MNAPYRPHAATERRASAVRHDVIGWSIVALLLIAQWVLFLHHARAEVTWAYPGSYDQVQYLLNSYDTYEQARLHGFLDGVRYGANLRLPQGMMIHLQAVALFMIGGASRLTALTLNFMYYALLQCVLAIVLRWVTGRWTEALMGIGLLLTATAPFFYAGGLFDFRLDFITLCLYAIFIGVVIRSSLFAHGRWSLIAGFVATLTVLFRFVTLTYFVGLFGVSALVLVWRFWRDHRDGMVRARLRGVGLAALPTIAVSAAAIASKWQAVAAYYVVGHLTGNEAQLRAREYGISNLADALMFYPRSVILDHTGPWFLAVALVLLAAAAWGSRRLARMRPVGPGSPNDFLFIFLASSFCVPLAVLSLNPAKSPVVGSVLTGPIVWTVLMILVAMLSVASRPLRITLACGALAAGLSVQIVHLRAAERFSQNRADVEAVLQLHDRIGQYSERAGWPQPRVSVDTVADYFFALNVTQYERHHRQLHARPGLGWNIFEVSETQALEILASSDFAVISLSDPPQDVYPFDRAMRSLRPKLLAFCDRAFVAIGEFTLFGRRVRLFARPTGRP